MYIPIEVIVILAIVLFVYIVTRLGKSNSEVKIDPPCNSVTVTLASDLSSISAVNKERNKVEAERWYANNEQLLLNSILRKAKKAAQIGDTTVYVGDELRSADRLFESYYFTGSVLLVNELKGRGMTISFGYLSWGQE